MTITGRLLDPERDRPVVETLPLVSPLIPAMELVHNGLLSRQHLLAAIERERAKVLDGTSTFDKLHDRKKQEARRVRLPDGPGRAHRGSGQGLRPTWICAIA